MDSLVDSLKQLMKLRLPLMNNIHTLLAKSVLIPLALTATASATDVGIKKYYGLVLLDQKQQH